MSRQAGTMREVRRSTEAPGDFGIGVIGVPAGSPIELNVRLEAVGEGVLVTGTAEVVLAGECVRCLEPIRQPDEIDIQELYYYPGNGPDDEETSRIKGERIDLEPILRDTVVLDLPFTPLCDDDCEGLCQTCGKNLNDDPDHTHGDDTDARWTGLAGWQPGDTK